MNTQSLPVRLTTDELLLRSDELAKTIREAADVEAAMKSAQAASKSKLGKLEADVARLARIVREKVEDRAVEVTEIRNWDSLTMDTLRLDTGEIVGSRAMSYSERNGTLFAADNAPRKADEPEPAAAPEESASAPEPPSGDPEPDPAAPAVVPAEEPAAAAPAAEVEPAVDKPAVN